MYRYRPVSGQLQHVTVRDSGDVSCSDYGQCRCLLTIITFDPDAVRKTDVEDGISLGNPSNCSNALALDFLRYLVSQGRKLNVPPQTKTPIQSVSSVAYMTIPGIFRLFSNSLHVRSAYVSRFQTLYQCAPTDNSKNKSPAASIVTNRELMPRAVSPVLVYIPIVPQNASCKQTGTALRTTTRIAGHSHYLLSPAHSANTNATSIAPSTTRSDTMAAMQAVIDWPWLFGSFR